MPISINRDQQARVFRHMLPAVRLSVVVILVAIAPVAISFLLHDIDPQVDDTLQYTRAGQQQTTSGTEATNDRPAAESQFIVLSARVSALQDAMTPILRDNAALAEQLRATQTQITEMAQDKVALAEQLRATQTQITEIARDKAAVAEQLKATQTQITQMAQDNASVAEQLKALTQVMARRAPVLAMGSDERERHHRTITRKLTPEVSRSEVTGAAAARRPAGALLPATDLDRGIRTEEAAGRTRWPPEGRAGQATARARRGQLPD